MVDLIGTQQAFGLAVSADRGAAALMMPSCAQSNESSRYMGLDLPSLVDPITYPKADMAAPASIDSSGTM